MTCCPGATPYSPPSEIKTTRLIMSIAFCLAIASSTEQAAEQISEEAFPRAGDLGSSATSRPGPPVLLGGEDEGPVSSSQLTGQQHDGGRLEAAHSLKLLKTPLTPTKRTRLSSPPPTKRPTSPALRSIWVPRRHHVTVFQCL